MPKMRVATATVLRMNHGSFRSVYVKRLCRRKKDAAPKNWRASFCCNYCELLNGCGITNVRIEHFLKFRFADCSNLLLHNLPSLEKQESGNAADSVAGCSLLVRINIQLAYLHLTGIIGRNL